jgi:hypothetical protein
MALGDRCFEAVGGKLAGGQGGTQQEWADTVVDESMLEEHSNPALNQKKEIIDQRKEIIALLGGVY